MAEDSRSCTDPALCLVAGMPVMLHPGYHRHGHRNDKGTAEKRPHRPVHMDVCRKIALRQGYGSVRPGYPHKERHQKDQQFVQSPEGVLEKDKQHGAGKGGNDDRTVKLAKEVNQHHELR